MLTLQNFESDIYSTILQRGKQYYSQKTVVWLEETEENIWQAEVEGSETYEVELMLVDKEEISDYSCDCPYDGEMCKHVVAVLYAVRAELKKPRSKQQDRKVGRNVFENLLQSISLKEYQDFIRHYVAKDKDFKTEFELFFADKDERIDVEKKYGDLIQKIIRKHSDHGYVDYRASYSLSRDMDKLLASGNDFVKKYNYQDAFSFAKAVLKPMMETITQADDSSGNLGETLNNIIELIEDIANAEEATLELKLEVFEFLQQELSDKQYFDYGDMGYELFSVYENLAIQLRLSEEFLDFADAQIRKLTGPYDTYRREFYQKRKIEFLAAIGNTDEAEELVQQSLDIVEVRQAVVEKAIAKKDYESAKKLIAEGIKVAENKNHPGTVTAWQKELLKIAALEKDTETIRHHARHLAFDTWFSAEFYKQWKATYSQAEWKEVIEKYIAETSEKIMKTWDSEKNKYWKPAHPPLLEKLSPIYIQEHYWDRLLALVQKEKSLATTLSYHKYLAPHYPAELLKIYLPAFEKAGQEANGRGAYADLASKMKQVMKDIPEGKAKIQEIARSLKAQFPRRPAMQEELNKILK
ncbi:hypothetical protein FVR03_16530 [Pontibacter qinzhouensis]|uniref:SWIM-type domain-containing protein n=1 Tax=Pontibacter qinzhouensis TaxID=2603253 RepID=A0A5C8JJY8_9BACT|nr:SWIM zinc finger family protein [Pontibacter qinzhouensis]TXK36897.1 hypothetical protein FVR03_16530 [Pontibacter qinzhouensis]